MYFLQSILTNALRSKHTKGRVLKTGEIWSLTTKGEGGWSTKTKSLHTVTKGQIMSGPWNYFSLSRTTATIALFSCIIPQCCLKSLSLCQANCVMFVACQSLIFPLIAGFSQCTHQPSVLSNN